MRGQVTENTQASENVPFARIAWMTPRAPCLANDVCGGEGPLSTPGMEQPGRDSECPIAGRGRIRTAGRRGKSAIARIPRIICRSFCRWAGTHVEAIPRRSSGRCHMGGGRIGAACGRPGCPRHAGRRAALPRRVPVAPLQPPGRGIRCVPNGWWLAWCPAGRITAGPADVTPSDSDPSCCDGAFRLTAGDCPRRFRRL